MYVQVYKTLKKQSYYTFIQKYTTTVGPAYIYNIIYETMLARQHKKYCRPINFFFILEIV